MKPVLLLIPGMLNTERVWGRVTPLLRDAAQVRIADVLSQSSIAEMARDAWAMVADVPAEQAVVVCGFSMGGYTAIEMMARPARPVQGLALLDTSGRPESAEGVAAREKTIAAVTADFERVIAGIATFATHAANHSDTALMQETLSIFRDAGAEATIRQNRAIMARGDHRGALAQLRLPVLVMCGRDDKLTPPKLSEELAALIPGARLEWIEGAGHMTPLEQPARLAALLKTLL